MRNFIHTPGQRWRARCWVGVLALGVANGAWSDTHASAQDPAADRRAHAPHTAEADRPTPPSISLVELLRAAEQNLPSVLAALATLKRVEAEQRVAEGAYLPRATGEATLGLFYDNRRVLPNSVDENDTTRINSLNFAAGAGVTLDWAAVDRSRTHTLAAAEASTRREGFGVQARKRVALAAATELYLRSLAATSLVEDAHLNLTRRTRQQESIAELAQAGVRPPVDAIRASVETVAARYVLEMRHVDEQASHAALAAAIGRSPERGLRPEPLTHDPFVGPTSIDEASRLARSERPEIRRLREQVEVQQANYRAVYAGRMPTLGLYAAGQATYYDVFAGEGIEGDQYNARGGLYMRWGGADAQVLRQRYVSEARIRETQRELEGTELSIRADVVDAAYAVSRASAQLELATQILEAARATRTAQQERYGAGTASLLDLLDAEALEQGARRTRIEAQRDFDLARVRLLAVCGTLGKLAPP